MYKLYEIPLFAYLFMANEGKNHWNFDKLGSTIPIQLMTSSCNYT